MQALTLLAYGRHCTSLTLAGARHSLHELEKELRELTNRYGSDVFKHGGSPEATMSDGTNADARVTLWLSEELKNEIDSEYIDWRYESRSQWVRESVQTRMALEDALAAQSINLPEDKSDRSDLIKRIVRAGVAATGDDLSLKEK